MFVNFKDGKCSACGECCGSAPYPFTLEDIKRVKDYVIKHNIKPHGILNEDTIDMTCAMFDYNTKRCMVYEARPEICRKFTCEYCNTHGKIKIKDAVITKDNKMVVASMDSLFNASPLQILVSLMLMSEEDYNITVTKDNFKRFSDIYIMVLSENDEELVEYFMPTNKILNMAFQVFEKIKEKIKINHV